MWKKLFLVLVTIGVVVTIAGCGDRPPCESCVSPMRPSSPSPPPVQMVTVVVIADADASALAVCPNGVATGTGHGHAEATITVPADQLEAAKAAKYQELLVIANAQAKATAVCVSTPTPPPPPSAPAPVPPPPVVVPPPPPPPAPTDVCPNIGGVQETIPPGMVRDGSGNCVIPPPPPPPPSPCTYAIATPAVFDYRGGNGSIGVNASRTDCPMPEVRSNNFWIGTPYWVIDQPSSWTAFFIVAGNGGGQRTGSITFTAPNLNRTISIQQGAAPGQ